MPSPLWSLKLTLIQPPKKTVTTNLTFWLKVKCSKWLIKRVPTLPNRRNREFVCSWHHGCSSPYWSPTKGKTPQFHMELSPKATTEWYPIQIWITSVHQRQTVSVWAWLLGDLHSRSIMGHYPAALISFYHYGPIHQTSRLHFGISSSWFGRTSLPESAARMVHQRDWPIAAACWSQVPW